MTFDLEPLERASWEATPSKIFMCQQKGQSERWCRNYVRVLHSFGENQLYACGTNAFQPSCSWRQVSGPSHVCVAVVATRLGLTCLDCGSNKHYIRLFYRCRWKTSTSPSLMTVWSSAPSIRRQTAPASSRPMATCSLAAPLTSLAAMWPSYALPCSPMGSVLVALLHLCLSTTHTDSSCLFRWIASASCAPSSTTTTG